MSDEKPTVSAPTPPIQLTPKAAAMIKEIRVEEKVPDEQVLRLGVKGGGCAGYEHVLFFDEPKPTDEQFEIDGVKIAVDPASLMYLDGTTLDYLSGLTGTGFKFINPQATSTCGCGNSFST